MYDFQLCYANYVDKFNTYAQNYADKLSTKPAVLAESIKYSLLNGGKRVRPVLLLATAKLLGVADDEALPFALALEMIHTYSLIHDDLPAMDNDEYRRGKPSCFKAFGEANAILAGDGLLNEAYAICLAEAVKGEKQLTAAQFLNECAGVYGMIAGQSADLLYTQKPEDANAENLAYIYEHKTGKLLLAPIAIASILSGGSSYFSLEHFAKKLGLLFQMTDDILDEVGEFESLGKTIGKDKKEEKLTCVRLYGLDNAKMRADLCADDCHALLEGVEGDTQFLHDLVDFVLNRTK